MACSTEGSSYKGTSLVVPGGRGLDDDSVVVVPEEVGSGFDSVDRGSGESFGSSEVS